MKYKIIFTDRQRLISLIGNYELGYTAQDFDEVRSCGCHFE